MIGGSETDPNRVADRPDIQKGKHKRNYERNMFVRIKDTPESGIWRGLTGPISSVVGPNIRVLTSQGLSGPLTAAELEPMPQECIDFFEGLD